MSRREEAAAAEREAFLTVADRIVEAVAEHVAGQPRFEVSRAALEADGSLHAAIRRVLLYGGWADEWVLAVALIRVPLMATLLFRLAAAQEARAERLRRARWSWQVEQRIAMSVRRPSSLITGGDVL